MVLYKVKVQSLQGYRFVIWCCWISWFSFDVSESGFAVLFWILSHGTGLHWNLWRATRTNQSVELLKVKKLNSRNPRDQLKTHMDSLSRQQQPQLQRNFIVRLVSSRSSPACPFWCCQKSLRCRTFWPLYRSPEWRSQSTRDIQKVQKLTRFHKSGNEYVTSKNESFMILIWILEKDKGPRLHDYNITTQDTPDTFRSRLDSQIPTLEKLARSKDYLALCIRGCWSIGLSHDVQRWNHYSFTGQ